MGSAVIGRGRHMTVKRLGRATSQDESRIREHYHVISLFDLASQIKIAT